jgi:hypothetical protein
MEPIPPPPSPSDEKSLLAKPVQARIRAVQIALDQYKQIAPGLDAWHPIHSLRPEECILSLGK